MTDRCILQADFSSFRPVSGRRVLQLVFEIAIENGEEALKMLGMPIPGEHRWCAIALLDLSKPKTEAQVSEANASPKKWAEYKPSQQAYLICRDPDFWRYAGVKDEASAAEWLCSQLRMESRSELDGDIHLEARWDEVCALYNLHRQAFK